MSRYTPEPKPAFTLKGDTFFRLGLLAGEVTNFRIISEYYASIKLHWIDHYFKPKTSNIGTILKIPFLCMSDTCVMCKHSEEVQASNGALERHPHVVSSRLTLFAIQKYKLNNLDASNRKDRWLNEGKMILSMPTKFVPELLKTIPDATPEDVIEKNEYAMLSVRRDRYVANVEVIATSHRDYIPKVPEEWIEKYLNQYNKNIIPKGDNGSSVLDKAMTKLQSEGLSKIQFTELHEP